MFSQCSRFVGAAFFCLLLALKAQPGQAFDKKGSQALSHYIMGVVYDDLGDIEKAIQEYSQALKEDTRSTHLRLSLASSYLKKNDLDSAVGQLKLAVDDDPEAVQPHAILSLLYALQKKDDLASREHELALKNAARSEPRNAQIYKDLGLVYLYQGKIKEAQGILRIAVGLAPDDAQAHFLLGNAYYELKEIKPAEKELLRALSIAPDYHEALNYLGYAYLEQDRQINRAGALIKKALEMEPDNPAYIDSLGWFYFKKGRFREALEQLEKAAALLKDPVIYDHLGDAYFKSGRLKDARLNWERSLELNPDQQGIKEKLEKVKI